MNRFLPARLRGPNGFRWILAAVLVALLLLGVGAVAIAHFRSGSEVLASVTQKPSTCADAYKVLALPPSRITAANSACFVQSLKFSGELSGGVAQAYSVSADNAGPTSACTVPKRWNGYPRASLAMLVGAKAYRLRISPPGASEHQTVKISNLSSVVELAAIGGPISNWNQASGTMTLNPDGITGAIDATLLRDAAGAKPVHVTGQWACGAPLPLPNIDASLPCSRFYSLNHLDEADVSRMKAQACNRQDLTFSGAIGGHLDSAITDRTYAAFPGISGDNFCALVGNKYEYDASLKFSFGDESFLLNLNPRSTRSIGPGQYPAGGAFGTNAVLWLGHADPDHNGRFVTDPKVFWSGSSGSFTVANDMKSGTIDETFSGAVSDTGSTVRITGNWRCAP
jgi:hypothetical protein